MSHSMTAQSHALHPPATHPARALQALLAGAIRRLRTLTWLRQVTPEEAFARDAAAVRALAYSCRNSDPGFASDLYAAVNRHECAFDAHAIGAR